MEVYVENYGYVWVDEEALEELGVEDWYVPDGSLVEALRVMGYELGGEGDE